MYIYVYIYTLVNIVFPLNPLPNLPIFLIYIYIYTCMYMLSSYYTANVMDQKLYLKILYIRPCYRPDHPTTIAVSPPVLWAPWQPSATPTAQQDLPRWKSEGEWSVASRTSSRHQSVGIGYDWLIVCFFFFRARKNRSNSPASYMILAWNGSTWQFPVGSDFQIHHFFSRPRLGPGTTERFGGFRFVIGVPQTSSSSYRTMGFSIFSKSSSGLGLPPWRAGNTHFHYQSL